jgi:transcriptional regulator with XRE-family HTH domain
MDKKISNFFKTLFDSKGIKYTFVANQMGLKRQTLWNKLKGKTAFNFEEILKLCEMYGINPNSFKEEQE